MLRLCEKCKEIVEHLSLTMVLEGLACSVRCVCVCTYTSPEGRHLVEVKLVCVPMIPRAMPSGVKLLVGSPLVVMLRGRYQTKCNSRKTSQSLHVKRSHAPASTCRGITHTAHPSLKRCGNQQGATAAGPRSLEAPSHKLVTRRWVKLSRWTLGLRQDNSSAPSPEQSFSGSKLLTPVGKRARKGAL